MATPSSNPCLVVGSAPCRDDDLAAAPDWPVIAVNYAGLELENIDLWMSVHGMPLCDWIRHREAKGMNMNFRAYGHVGEHLVGRVNFPDPFTPTTDAWCKERNINPEGSSGKYATEMAIFLGFSPVLLCGIPLEGSVTLQEKNIPLVHADRRDHYGKTSGMYTKYHRKWLARVDHLKPHVRSMSGWTREIFGGPDE